MAPSSTLSSISLHISSIPAASAHLIISGRGNVSFFLGGVICLTAGLPLLRI